MSLVRKGVDSTVRGDLTESKGNLQTQSHSYLLREPLTTEIPDQGFVLADVSGTKYVYFRVGNARFRIAATAV